jgi:nucleoside-diphosphate-sugar epimerase
MQDDFCWKRVSMKKILITGGAGFIGYHLAKKLSYDGFNITIVDNNERGVKDKDLDKLIELDCVQYIQLDLLQENEFNKLEKDYEFIFHMAAIIGVSHVMNRPYDVLTKNVSMLENIITFSKKQNNLKRLFFASTSEIYAGTLKYFDLTIPTKETTPLAITDLAHPRTSYMLSKIYGEAICQHSSIPTTIVRPHNIYGPRMGMSHVIPELLKKSYFSEEGGAIKVYSIKHKRSFCYIDDAIDQLFAMMENNSSENLVFNLGTESPEVTMEEVANICFNTVDKSLIIDKQPATPGSPTRRAPNMDNSFNKLGVKSKITLENGILKTFNWYKHNIFDTTDVHAI